MSKNVNASLSGYVTLCQTVCNLETLRDTEGEELSKSQEKLLKRLERVAGTTDQFMDLLEPVMNEVVPILEPLAKELSGKLVGEFAETLVTAGLKS